MLGTYTVATMISGGLCLIQRIADLRVRPGFASAWQAARQKIAQRNSTSGGMCFNLRGPTNRTGITMAATLKVVYAIAAILGGGAFGSAVAANSTEASSASDQIKKYRDRTAAHRKRTKRTGSAIQALTGETRSKLNVTTFDDLIKYLPM